MSLQVSNINQALVTNWHTEDLGAFVRLSRNWDHLPQFLHFLETLLRQEMASLVFLVGGIRVWGETDSQNRNKAGCGDFSLSER